MSVIRLLPLFLAAILVARAQEPKGLSVELKNLKNESIKGELAGITDKEIVIEAGGKKVTTANDQVLSLTFTAEPDKIGPETKYALVELDDGSQLKCATYSLKGKDAKLVLLQGQTVDVPLTRIAWVLNEANVPQHMKDFKDKVLAKKMARDMLAIKTDEVVNVIHGTLGEADAEGKNIEFITKEGTKREVAIERPLAMYFQRGPNPAAKPVICRMSDTARNLLFVSGISKTAEGFTVITSAGATIKYPTDKVARLDYSTGKLAYLSQNLTPTSVTETSTEGAVQKFRRDENLEGGKIRLAGVEYKSGLSMHATTELEYDLDGEYRELKAIAGIDDDVGGDDGPTVLKVYGDNVEIFSWTVSRKDKERVKQLAINIKDVKKLKIVVTTGDILDLGKHLTLAEARVSK